MREQALGLIKGLDLCVVSSVNPQGNSESAIVGFSENDKFEIMIGTSKKSRKYQNILNNPSVSIVFGPLENQAVQYEGLAQLIEGEELAERKKIHFKKLPGAMKYESNLEQTYILIKPKWLRFVASGPKNLGEMEFNR